MTKEKSGTNLESFKIGDAVKRPISPNSPAQAATSKKKGGKPEPAPSVGFPTIEKVIEADVLDRSGLQTRMEALTELGKSGNTKQKPAAKKALLAYEHTSELLDYLWATKQKLISPEAGQEPQDSNEGAPGDPRKKGSAR